MVTKQEVWTVLGFVAIVFASLLFIGIGCPPVHAQEPSVVDLPTTPDAPEWAQKIAAGVRDGADVTLTAVEAQAAWDAIVELERARPTDIAVSGTRVYVISAAGEIVATTTLPDTGGQQ